MQFETYLFSQRHLTAASKMLLQTRRYSRSNYLSFFCTFFSHFIHPVYLFVILVNVCIHIFDDPENAAMNHGLYKYGIFICYLAVTKLQMQIRKRHKKGEMSYCWPIYSFAFFKQSLHMTSICVNNISMKFAFKTLYTEHFRGFKINARAPSSYLCFILNSSFPSWDSFIRYILINLLLDHLSKNLCLLISKYFA